jgi:membrane protein required for beta-lactamase induction
MEANGGHRVKNLSSMGNAILVNNFNAFLGFIYIFVVAFPTLQV